MKLIIAIVSNEDCSLLMKALVNHKYFVTKLSSSGGFLKKGNATLMIGAKPEDIDDIIKIISDYSKTRKEMVPASIISEFGTMPSIPFEVTVGGATLFIVDVELFIKL
ncbi:MAG TPA: transcriptional regulator [Acholeplasmataceae bacterium]|nr:transcriptional regulator [Acholeplasmataceae bacterium]